jgi:hypothetical protein
MTKAELLRELKKGGYGIDLRPEIKESYYHVRYDDKWGWHIVYRPTEKGFPTFWEFGGSYTNKGEAQIVGDKLGRPMKPIYIRTRGHLACLWHALFIARVGMRVAVAKRWRENWLCAIFTVKEIIPGVGTPLDSRDGILKLELTDVFTGKGKEADWPVPDTYRPMVVAALEKAYHYHCREPHYIIQ